MKWCLSTCFLSAWSFLCIVHYEEVSCHSRMRNTLSQSTVQLVIFNQAQVWLSSKAETLHHTLRWHLLTQTWVGSINSEWRIPQSNRQIISLAPQAFPSRARKAGRDDWRLIHKICGAQEWQDMLFMGLIRYGFKTSRVTSQIGRHISCFRSRIRLVWR